MHERKLHVAGRAAEVQLFALELLVQKGQVGDPFPDEVVENDNVAMLAELGRPIQDALDVYGG